MARRTLLLSVLALLMSLVAPPVSVHGQNRTLASYLPDPSQLPLGMVVVDQGTPTLDEVAATFADPAKTKQQLERWGWQENAVLELAQGDSPWGLTMVQISLHRFQTSAGATEALAAFVAERAADLGLHEVHS